MSNIEGGEIVGSVTHMGRSIPIRFLHVSYNWQCPACGTYDGGYSSERGAKSAAKKHIAQVHPK